MEDMNAMDRAARQVAQQNEQRIQGAGVDPWKGRSTGMRCRSCVWFVPKEASGVRPDGYPIVGRCRRHAPTMNGFPVVYLTDWCGDHRLDENKI